MYDIREILFLLFELILAIIIIAVPVMITFLGYKWLAAKGYRSIAIVLVLCVSGWIAYSVFTAIYPTDAFFFNEFREVTLRDAPSSSKVIHKTASFPDFHGDYGSASLIGLSSVDYQSLLSALSNDPRLTKGGEIFRSDESDRVMGKLESGEIQYRFTRNISTKENLHLYIGFFRDGKTILVSRSNQINAKT